jgi:hypothetical protein
VAPQAVEATAEAMRKQYNLGRSVAMDRFPRWSSLIAGLALVGL